MSDTVTKRCSKCETEKKHSEFQKRAASKDGLSVWCRSCYKRYNASRYNPDDSYYNHIKRTYGVTRTEYNTMLVAQDFICAACRNPSRQRLVVDHSHTTGIVRGLLCNGCNASLGHMKDNPLLIQGLLEYLNGD